MIDVATFLGAEPSRVAQEMREVLEFEIMLANFSLPREERRNASKLYNPMRIKDVSNFDPHTPWLEYINNILTSDIIQVSHVASNNHKSFNFRGSRSSQFEEPISEKKNPNYVPTSDGLFLWSWTVSHFNQSS